MFTKGWTESGRTLCQTAIFIDFLALFKGPMILDETLDTAISSVEKPVEETKSPVPSLLFLSFVIQTQSVKDS